MRHRSPPAASSGVVIAPPVRDAGGLVAIDVWACVWAEDGPSGTVRVDLARAQSARGRSAGRAVAAQHGLIEITGGS